MEQERIENTEIQQENKRKKRTALQGAEQTQNLTEGPILAPLCRFAVPVLFALLLQATYGAADLLIVGRFGSGADISAVSTGSQTMQTITSVITGLAMGVTVLIGQKIGEGKAKEAGQIVGSGIGLFLLLGIVLTVLLSVKTEGIVRLTQAPAQAFIQTTAYVRICSLGFVFIIAYNVLGSIFRGIGDSTMPLVTVAIASVLNIAGDLLLVAGFHLGAEGAAIATVAAQAVSVLLSFLMIQRRELPFVMVRQDLCLNRRWVGRILKLGIPVALQDLLVNLSFLVIIVIVNSMGVQYSAGVGVAEKLCMFIMLVPSAFMQSMSVFVAQNIGANQKKRAKKGLLYGIGTSLAVSVFLAYASFFHGEVMASWFAADAEIIVQAADYLKAYALDTLLTSFLFSLVGYYNGCGKTLFVMLQGIAGAFLVRIPVSYLMSRSAGATLFRIGLATPVSSIVQILLCVGYFVLLEQKNRKRSGRNV